MPAEGISPKLSTWGSQPSGTDTLHTPPALGVAPHHFSWKVPIVTSSGTFFFLNLICILVMCNKEGGVF